MIRAIKFKFNKIKVSKELDRYVDLKLYRYTAKCRLRDGTEVFFGNNYRLTTSDFDSWVKCILCKDVIHTNNNTYIKSCNIIETELHYREMIKTKYKHNSYWDSQYTWNYDDEDIDIHMKEYNKLKALSMIK